MNNNKGARINIVEVSNNILYSNATNVASSINDFQIGFLQRSINIKTNEEEIREVVKVAMSSLEVSRLVEVLHEHLKSQEDNIISTKE